MVKISLVNLHRYWAIQAGLLGSGSYSVARLAEISYENGLYANTSNITVSLDKYTFDIR